MHRGLKTLALRFRQQSETALHIARFLAEHPAVARVNYPGLPSHPQHERARRLLTGGMGGMLSFELRDGRDAAERLLGRVRIPLHAPSLGGPETLLTRPAASNHVGLAPEERRAVGISDGLLRMSVGLAPVARQSAERPVSSRQPANRSALPARQDPERDEIVSRARGKNPKAFEPWSRPEEEDVRRRYESGESVDAIARAHNRSPKVIQMRLERLGAAQRPGS